MFKKTLLSFFAAALILVSSVIPQTITAIAATTRQMENLDRGVVAVKVSNGVFVSWRVLGTESSTISYNLYRDSVKIANIIGASNYVDTAGTIGSKYSVSAVVNGLEQTKSTAVSVWGTNYLQVPLQIPAGGTTPDNVAYTYSPNDCSVGDLDGDGQYEIVLKWDPSNSKDNSQSGYTGNVFLDAYEMNGTRLWRIDLGKNIRAGAHYTQFMVYDLNGDGKAEVACKTADGTKDGAGIVIGNASADYRNSSGYILSGPEYLTVFQGSDGKALYTCNYEPARGTVSSWGDSYGNRVDRFLACIAYLDGVHPSLVMCRGYYTRAVLVAYDWNGSTLTKRWTFDSSSSGNSSYAGQGNHNLSVADVDSDGKDEIVYGGCTIDDTGKGLYSTGLRHGDALHVSDLDPSRPGLEVWSCHEDVKNNGGIGGSFRDAKTGQVLWKFSASGDTGRACSADVTASYPGEEVWASGSTLFSSKGENIGNRPSPVNFAIWWDGDDLRELLDDTTISKYGKGNLLSVSDCDSNNTTKATPCLQADILGDWREEVIWRTTDNKYLRIYTTTDVTSRRIYTLMHDPVYRLGVAWQNVAYNQPPHTGFFLGSGMSTPPTPSITLVGASTPTTPTTPPTPISIPDGQYIKSMLVNDTDNGADWSIQSNLQVGDVVYGDRTNKFSTIPSKLLGAEWIRTACDSKVYTSDLATFTTKANVSIYVGLDARVTSIPSWLSGWTNTGETLTNDSSVTFNLYKKDFPANSNVVLGTNGGSSTVVNYTTIVVPTPITGANIADGTVFMLKNKTSNLYMEVQGGTAANGTNVQQWGASGSASHNTWRAVSAGDGYYRIYSQLSDGKTYLLDVASGKSDNGTNIQIYSNTNSDAQLFKFVYNNDGTYTLVTKASQDRSCVEVINASTASGANVQEWQTNGNNCQKWILEKITTVLYGDINKDGNINSLDFALLKKYIIGESTFSTDQLTAADMNKDGSVNSLDFALLKKQILSA